MNTQDYDYLCKLLRERSGLVLSSEKQYLVESRLLPLARKNAMTTLAELVAKIKSAPTAPLAAAVVEAMTTNESFFFRDQKPFDHFKTQVLPHMVKERAAKKSFRIWCAAASTGQEPYFLAILLKEAAAMLSGWRVEIIATDLSREVLERAKSGLFSQF